MKKLLAVFWAALTLAGCSSVNTVERADPQSRPQMVNDKRIVTDDDLNDYAYVAGVNESIVGGNLLKIQVKLVNTSTAYRTVNYKFSWFDESGMEVSSPTASWGTVMLEGGEAKYISAVATNPRVKDFSLKLLPDVRDY